MSEPKQTPQIRDAILANPQALLDDVEVMRALIQAETGAQPKNVIDLKSVVMKRLEKQIVTIKDQRSTIISAAYDNIAATAMIHRAVLQLLAPIGFENFLKFLANDWAASLQVPLARLCLETDSNNPDELAQIAPSFGDGVRFLSTGEIDYYLTLGRDISPLPVTIRHIRKGAQKIHGPLAEDIRTEALIKLDLGPNTRPALIVLASPETDKFTPDMGTELLEFYGTVFEHVIQNWTLDASAS